MSVSRRTLLAGALASSAVFSPPLQAQPIPRVPAIDRLEVLFLTDGSVFAFGEPVRRPDLLVELARPVEDHRASLTAEWGLSLALRSHQGGVQRNVLMDFGYTPRTLANNMGVLQFDLSEVDACLLSHGHFDHFGGIDAVLRDPRLKRGIPLRVGGEEAFCERQRGGGDRPLPFGAIDRGALSSAGVVVEIEPRPRLFADHAFTSGRIPLVTSERPVVPTRMSPGRGCQRAALDPEKQGADWLQDDAAHELGLVYHLRDRGLVVIGSCSHRGILNTIRQAQAVSGIERVHAILGGFHLVPPQTPAQVEETARGMASMSPDYVVPGHCSGERFIEAAMRVMPGKVIRPYVGSRFIFGRQA